MKVEFTGTFDDVAAAAAAALLAEERGYDGWKVGESHLDPLIACAAAAERTERVEIGSSVTIALARTPMTVALAANDLQALAGGRFTLGLGSQVGAHLARRYSAPADRPAARLREFVFAVRAIWRAWATGERLRFEGDFYTHTLMPPFFDPGPNPHGNPPIHLAAVGPLMTAVAGEVADGLICHAFSTERYVREVTLPRLAVGRARAGKTLSGFELTAPGFVVAAESERELEAGLAHVRQQIGFYGSTPAYRPVLELHGWGALQEELHALAARGEWQRLGDAIDDEVLNAFAVAGTPPEVADELVRRYGDIATRVSIAVPGCPDLRAWGPALDFLHSVGVGAHA